MEIGSSIRLRCSSIRDAACSARSRWRLIQYRLSATRESILFVYDPRVFAAATLRGVNHQRSAAERNPRQAPRNNVDFVAKENVRTQVHVSGMSLAVHETWRSREIHHRLGDVVARVGKYAAPKLLLLLFATVRTDQHPVPPRLAHRLHYHLAQVIENVRAVRMVGHEESFNVF